MSPITTATPVSRSWAICIIRAGCLHLHQRSQQFARWEGLPYTFVAQEKRPKGPTETGSRRAKDRLPFSFLQNQLQGCYSTTGGTQTLYRSTVPHTSPTAHQANHDHDGQDHREPFEPHHQQPEGQRPEKAPGRAQSLATITRHASPSVPLSPEPAPDRAHRW